MPLDSATSVMSFIVRPLFGCPARVDQICKVSPPASLIQVNAPINNYQHLRLAVIPQPEVIVVNYYAHPAPPCEWRARRSAPLCYSALSSLLFLLKTLDILPPIPANICLNSSRPPNQNVTTTIVNQNSGDTTTSAMIFSRST